MKYTGEESPCINAHQPQNKMGTTGDMTHKSRKYDTKPSAESKDGGGAMER